MERIESKVRWHRKSSFHIYPTKSFRLAVGLMLSNGQELVSEVRERARAKLQEGRAIRAELRLISF